MASATWRVGGDRGHPARPPLRLVAGLERVAAALSYRETGNPFPAREETRPPLRVGLCSSLSRGFLRDLIREVRANPDAPPLSFEEGAPDELIKATSFDEIDLAFVPGERDWWRLEHEELWRESLVLLAPEGHLLTRDTEVRPQALRDATLLVAGGPSELAFQTEQLTRAIGVAPSQIRTLAVERETLAELVGLGFGLALTTTSALGAFQPGVAYRPVAAPAQPVPFHAIWRANNCDGGLAGVVEMARGLAADRRHGATTASRAG
jgi:DNA-binding transcriptional LysR family regulator